ncbi:hypothetical protein RR46_02560 [Papilio xuthus]|uniref:Uncharacterized protein n=1 Tax=Papilio xuthus TaxID=66420 RepID=A0A194Q279_PAPXU|nr:hypothetical protein RR46_02560 [Papilio xuthus]
MDARKISLVPVFHLGRSIVPIVGKWELMDDQQGKISSSDESPGVGLSLNRSQHDAALPSTTPRQERKSSTDYSELRHRTELNSNPGRRDAYVLKPIAPITRIQMGSDVAPHECSATSKDTLFRASRLSELHSENILAGFG